MALGNEKKKLELRFQFTDEGLINYFNENYLKLSDKEFTQTLFLDTKDLAFSRRVTLKVKRIVSSIEDIKFSNETVFQTEIKNKNGVEVSLPLEKIIKYYSIKYRNEITPVGLTFYKSFNFTDKETETEKVRIDISTEMYKVEDLELFLLERESFNRIEFNFNKKSSFVDEVHSLVTTFELEPVGSKYKKLYKLLNDYNNQTS